jgi:NAD(P)-dependent dehydrogenase (short-subunit alcohol dehydrogenase family)
MEYSHLRCRNIDLVLPTPGSQEEDTLVNLLLGEISATSDEATIALRGSHRWLQSYELLQLTSDVPTQRLRQGGVYLITGGLGGIGLGMAEYLARTVQARLVLLGRSTLPPRESWPELLATTDATKGIGYKLRKIQDLEALGAEVLLVEADVANEAQMQTAMQQVVARFGTLHGVIHAAGVPGIGLMQMKTPEQAARVIAPKVAGTLILDKALQAFSLDFLVLCSSITSFMGGGPGQVDYCAANSFLDAFAQSRTSHSTPVLAINWSEWQWNAWEEGLEGYDKNTQQFFRENRRRFGISFGEGTEALRRLLSTPFAQVIVSPQDFRVFAELGKLFTAASLLENVQEIQQERPKYARPLLGSSYIAPSTELEHRITSIWEKILGISGIGTQDNFFELGGNSLIGLDVIAHMRKELDVEVLPAYVLYEAPSVSTIAQYLEQTGTSEKIADRYDRGERRRASLKRRMSETRKVR